VAARSTRLSTTVERGLATVGDGEAHREIDERNARFWAAGPPGCPPRVAPGDDLDVSQSLRCLSVLYPFPTATRGLRLKGEQRTGSVSKVGGPRMGHTSPDDGLRGAERRRLCREAKTLVHGRIARGQPARRRQERHRAKER
jgi:hypothetical protein